MTYENEAAVPSFSHAVQHDVEAVSVTTVSH